MTGSPGGSLKILLQAAALQNTVLQVATVPTAADHTELSNNPTTHWHWEAIVACQPSVQPSQLSVTCMSQPDRSHLWRL